MRLKQLTRRWFTLIELLAVMALIAVASSMGGFYAVKAVRHERFSASVRRVVDRLQMAQDLMLVSSADGVGMDVSVAFRMHESSYVCFIGFEGTFPKKSRHLFKSNLPLDGVSDVKWEGESRVEAPGVVLSYSALQGFVPKGRLTLVSVSGEERSIDCRGYPAKYRSRRPPSTAWREEETASESLALYPKELSKK
jgi:prepilin-type N-terminal cleavage/methylation domain-containing protein